MATKKLATPHPRLALPHTPGLKIQPPAGVYFLTSNSSFSSDCGLYFRRKQLDIM
jgi:hypothetical protein